MNPAFLHDALQGLGASPKTLPCKWIYDATGSALFEAICELPEYYLTRTEQKILEENALEIAELLGRTRVLVEMGSGSSRKTRVLLRALSALRTYLPVDISPAILSEGAALLEREFPALKVVPILADYTRDIPLPHLGNVPRAVFFPGSTIGNFSPSQARTFLNRIGKLGEKLLIGVDLYKSSEVLLPAYNDAQGVTARFNLNLLARLNSECCANFTLENWSHHAIWNDRKSRVEMQLRADRAQKVRIESHSFQFEAGETITTEHCYKWRLDDFESLVGRAGWKVEKLWCDEKKWFSVQLLQTI